MLLLAFVPESDFKATLAAFVRAPPEDGVVNLANKAAVAAASAEARPKHTYSVCGTRECREHRQAVVAGTSRRTSTLACNRVRDARAMSIA